MDKAEAAIVSNGISSARIGKSLQNVSDNEAEKDPPPLSKIESQYESTDHLRGWL